MKESKSDSNCALSRADTAIRTPGSDFAPRRLACRVVMTNRAAMPSFREDFGYTSNDPGLIGAARAATGKHDAGLNGTRSNYSHHPVYNPSNRTLHASTQAQPHRPRASQ
jgi:hypothetical protein